MKKVLLGIMCGLVLTQFTYGSSDEGALKAVRQVNDEVLAPNQVLLNGKLLEIPGGVLELQGQKLYPLRWFVSQMGGTVTWNHRKKTATVENPSYQEAHLYLSYLSGLTSEGDEQVPLPQRALTLQLPEYPLKNDWDSMLHETPIGITIDDEGFNIPFVAYDYAFKNNQLYVSFEWLNTIFLADMKPSGTGLVITYPTKVELESETARFEAILAPITPEETLALWIRGQQVRSGALQYSSLSPELKEQVLASKKGWATGGSSPSAGKATIISKEAPDANTLIYTLEIEQLLQGENAGSVKEQLTIKKYTLQSKDYWLISDAKGELTYFTMLPDAPIV